MKVLYITVTGQSLVWGNPFPIVAGSQEYLYCKFTYSEDWDNLDKQIRFYNTADKKYYAVEDLDGFVLIPHEVLCGRQFFIAAGGMKDSIFVPTAALRVKLEGNGYGESDEGLAEGESYKSTAAALTALAEECRDYCEEMSAINEEIKKELPSFVPKIGENGNWYIYNPDTKAYEDSDIKAQGVDGVDGTPGEDGKPYAYVLTVDEEGNLYCEYAGIEDAPFVYDDETGYLYYVTENSTKKKFSM